jgi:hypothetical protein
MAACGHAALPATTLKRTLLRDTQDFYFSIEHSQHRTSPSPVPGRPLHSDQQAAWPACASKQNRRQRNSIRRSIASRSDWPSRFSSSPTRQAHLGRTAFRIRWGRLGQNETAIRRTPSRQTLSSHHARIRSRRRDNRSSATKTSRTRTKKKERRSARGAHSFQDAF